MSAPEVGDRVRVIAGQWTGWGGVVLGKERGVLWVDLDTSPVSILTWTHFERNIPAAEVETVPTTPASTPVSDEQGAYVGLDPEAANGAQNGGKR